MISPASPASRHVHDGEVAGHAVLLDEERRIHAGALREEEQLLVPQLWSGTSWKPLTGFRERAAADAERGEVEGHFTIYWRVLLRWKWAAGAVDGAERR